VEAAAVAEKPDEKADGFLGRWARRKNDALHGKPLQEAAPRVKVVEPAAPVAGAVTANSPEDKNSQKVSGEAGGQAPDLQPAPARELSLDDARLLTKDSDFKPFMASNVGAEVRNAAMKKLFADPHFNVMDGLDIYVDDYSVFEPIPESMLRQMTSAKFLRLFDDDEDPDNPGQSAIPGADHPDGAGDKPRETANGPTDETVAHLSDEPVPHDPGFSTPTKSSPPELLNDAGASPKEHDHTDLRLQPDHAAPGSKAGRAT
jgi:hypothetical protein